MSAARCKVIIDSGAEVSGLAGSSLIGNLNMVASAGVTPTEEEARIILEAGEVYCKTIRRITHGWVARAVENGDGGEWETGSKDEETEDTRPGAG